MTGINGLPKEILHEIVSYLSPHISELLMSSLVCRGLSEVANAALYRDIDLSIVDLSIDERWDEQAGAKTRRRQLRLLRSISEYIYSSQMVYHY
jgi:F-box-like